MILSLLFSVALQWPALPAYSTSTAEVIVRAAARKWNVSGDEMWQTTLCENPGLDPTQQSNVIDKNGKREESYGNSQINLPWHPEVSKEQAQNPYFAADFMGRYFAEGKQGMWTCWNWLYKKKPAIARLPVQVTPLKEVNAKAERQ